MGSRALKTGTVVVNMFFSAVDQYGRRKRVL